MAICRLLLLRAQDLSPRAYVITPLHSNAIIVTWSFYDGTVLFDGSVPVTGATGTYNVPILGYYHSFSFFGRSANITASLPYAVGNFQGTVVGAEKQLYRSGLLDSSFRFSVNLMGGPAMAPQKFAKWQQKILLGASLKVVAPTGQYDPTNQTADNERGLLFWIERFPQFPKPLSLALPFHQFESAIRDRIPSLICYGLRVSIGQQYIANGVSILRCLIKSLGKLFVVRSFSGHWLTPFVCFRSRAEPLRVFPLLRFAARAGVLHKLSCSLPGARAGVIQALAPNP
jgi:hypothetical protein